MSICWHKNAREVSKMGQFRAEFWTNGSISLISYIVQRMMCDIWYDWYLIKLKLHVIVESAWPRSIICVCKNGTEVENGAAKWPKSPFLGNFVLNFENCDLLVNLMPCVKHVVWHELWWKSKQINDRTFQNLK